MYDEFAPEFTSEEFLMNLEPEEEEETEGDTEESEDEEVDLPDVAEEEEA